MEYVNKRWDLPVMEKKLENLKKIIPPGIVDGYIKKYENLADSKLDALYLAFYALKDVYCKVRRDSFGTPKTVEFKYKVRQSDPWYYGSYSIADSLYGTAASVNDSYWNYAAVTSATTSSTWTVTTATNTYWNML